MQENKIIKRDGQSATKIFDNRSLQMDYRTLRPLLKKGMKVLDVGCGTGAISKDIAKIVGEEGSVVGIDKTEKFIESGKHTYQSTKNLQLYHSNLFEFEPMGKFDLIVSARTMQWLTNPKEALTKMKIWLKPEGQLSILDYNHEDLNWNPTPPKSMLAFYQTFLKWRKDAGLNNRIAEDLADMMEEVGFKEVEAINSNEHYDRTRPDYNSKVGIWSKVAGSTQMVEEGYIDDDLRLKAIDDYNAWVESDAISMTMKLNEVRGKNN